MGALAAAARKIAPLAITSAVAFACGLSTTGSGAGDVDETDGAAIGSSDANANETDGQVTPVGDGAPASPDAATDSSVDSGVTVSGLDATFDAGPTIPKCPTTTADAFSLASFVEKGTAKNITAAIELTSDTNNQAGAAWYQSAFTAVPQGVSVAFSFTEAGGADDSIDGGFAVVFLAANPPQTLPNVGASGTSFGACGMGAVGFAIVVDVAFATNGGNGDSVKIIDVSNCHLIAGADFGGVNANTAYVLTMNFNSGKVTASFDGANATGTITMPSPLFFGVSASTGTQPSTWLFSGVTATFAGCP